MKAAIYHFTDGSEKRPSINTKQLDQLTGFAASHGYTDSTVFCDKSLLRGEHPEFDRFWSTAEQFDALFTKDFYHISKNTMHCMHLMQELQGKGIHVYSMENGSFSWENAPFDRPLKVASYCCGFGDSDKLAEIISVKNDIISLFASQKTNWIVSDQYFDKSVHQNDGDQPQLAEFLHNSEKYDLLIVHNLNDIHRRTAKFCKIREQHKLDIYSLQEGFLKYDKEKAN